MTCIFSKHTKIIQEFTYKSRIHLPLIPEHFIGRPLKIFHIFSNKPFHYEDLIFHRQCLVGCNKSFLKGHGGHMSHIYYTKTSKGLDLVLQDDGDWVFCLHCYPDMPKNISYRQNGKVMYHMLTWPCWALLQHVSSIG